MSLPHVVHEHGGVEREHSLQPLAKEHKPEIFLKQGCHVRRGTPNLKKSGVVADFAKFVENFMIRLGISIRFIGPAGPPQPSEEERSQIMHDTKKNEKDARLREHT